jgi:hypothetical protein
MALGRTTIRLSGLVERWTRQEQAQSAAVGVIIAFAGVLLVTAGLLIVFGAKFQAILIPVGALAGLGVLVLMLVRHDWLFLFGVVAGHTIFYGRFPYNLGLRIRDSVGPGDLFLFLAFVASLVYWMNKKDRPRMPWALFIPAVASFAYMAGYTLIAFFLWERQDNALIMGTGWLYFATALPAFFCLTGGRIWKPFFAILFTALIASGILSSFAEAGVFYRLLVTTGYGGVGTRSFGDTGIKTPFLGMGVLALLYASAFVAFARRPGWVLLSVFGCLGGLVMLFLDRGRIHWAGTLVALMMLLVVLHTPNRLKLIATAVASLLTLILLIQAAGGPVRQRFNDAVFRAWRRVQAATPTALMGDAGLGFRVHRKRRAEAIWRENPLFGGGPGVTFGYEVNVATGEVGAIVAAGMDDSLIYPLAIGGLVGGALLWGNFLVFFIVALYAFTKLRNPFHRALAMAPIGHFVYIMMCVPVTWWLIDRFHIAAFSMGVATSLALLYHERMNGSETPIIPV